ncbi:MAG: ABC transporter permease [Deltaproteobacteria bacterium]|nr:ABC transporter permease [Deltaproteobacteria bacterium]
MILPRAKHALPAVLVLALAHGLLAMWAELFPLSTNLVLFAANCYLLYCGWLVLRDGGLVEVVLFAAGYGLLFGLVAVLLGRESLFILMVVLYGSVFRVRFLLGLFVLFVLGYVVFQPYAFETFVLLGAAFAAVWALKRRGASPFLVACLAFGLFGLVAVLLPVVHLLVQDSPQTLGYVLSRRDVQEAIGVSLLSSCLATLIVALWGVPLAYALARSSFKGKSVIESLVDLPILVPQSVVGIALLVLLGPGSPLGQALEGYGLSVSGRFAGIVAAQVFVACPFLIKTAVTAFEGVPAHLEEVSRTLGASTFQTFMRVSLPLASRGLAVGLILAWARAISEFGAIVLFAPDPLSAPVLVHAEFLRAGVAESRPIAVLLLLVCLWVFVLLGFGKRFLPAPFGAGADGRRAR